MLGNLYDRALDGERRRVVASLAAT